MNKIIFIFLAMFFLYSCSTTTDNYLGYYWNLYAIEGEKLTNPVPSSRGVNTPHLVFTSINRFSGNTGCNAINGRYERNMNLTHFIGVVTSKMQCSDKTFNKIERSFISSINQAEFMIINIDTLTIYSKNKDIMLQFKRGDHITN